MAFEKKPIPNGFHCVTCNKWHPFSAYVYAHANVHLVHTCDCGAKHELLNFRVEQTKRGKPQ